MTDLAKIHDIPPDELMEIIEAGKEALAHQRYFEFSDLGLVVHGDPPFEAWAATVISLEATARNIPLWIGDIVNQGEQRYGQKYVQFIDMRAYGTLRNWAWVCSAVPIERRRLELSFSHYAKVAPLDKKSQIHYLDEAVEKEWSANELGRVLAKERMLPGPLPQILECLGKLVLTDKGWICELHTSIDLSQWAGNEVTVSITEAR